MSRAEAIRLVTERVRAFRARPVSEIVDRYEDDSETVETVGRDGLAYQVQVQAWADFDGALLVWVNVDGGGIPATRPLAVAFRSAAARDGWNRSTRRTTYPAPRRSPSTTAPPLVRQVTPAASRIRPLAERHTGASTSPTPSASGIQRQWIG